MWITVEIDDALLASALQESRLRDAFGKYPWDGDLPALRRWRRDTGSGDPPA